jgi:acetyl esterase/lipase
VRPSTSAGALLPIRLDSGLAYAGEGDPALKGDLYRPAETALGPGERTPVVLIVHGGAFKGGSRGALAHWGRWLARQGVAAFSIDYTLATTERPSFPTPIEDARAAIAYLRAHADELGLDAGRIAAMGCSAGATIAASLALSAGRETDVKTAIVICGVHDMIAQWEHDQLHRPTDQQTEIYLGGNPMTARERFYEASPLVHASQQNAAGTRWLVAWGTDDNVVDPRQSTVLAEHLNRAGAMVRLAPIADAAHLWYLEGQAGEIDAEGSTFNGRLAERILVFLTDWCGW